jgi:hypothetical protein
MSPLKCPFRFVGASIVGPPLGPAAVGGKSVLRPAPLAALRTSHPKQPAASEFLRSLRHVLWRFLAMLAVGAREAG